MKFVDEAKIFIKAGDGGKGMVSFRREKYVPRGGPDGGNGGKGGDVIMRASLNHHTLLDLSYNQHHVAERGGSGGGNNRTGKNGKDIEILVPVGTVVTDTETCETLCDLSEPEQSCVVAKGGIGGKGNAHFATSTHRTPRFAQEGMPGEERWVKLEVKLIADAGLVGFPNAGKSTFISRVSAARPKIADYPFTTLSPVLGVVSHKDNTFVIADIPGLIEGAHEGLGLGVRFLKHIERTYLLVHLIDISGDKNPWKDYQAINKELGSFSPALLEKPQLVAFTKIDLPDARARLKKAVDLFKRKGIKIFPVSAATGEGLPELLDEIIRLLSARKADKKKAEKDND
jgi:GTP-binding protein